MNSDYDVIVLGGGSPGEHCAGALAEGGLRVAVVERELVGGECSYWACIPSKTLLRPGEAVHGAREAAASAEVDVEAAFAWRDFIVSDCSDAGQERWLELVLSANATAARRDGEDYVLEFDDGRGLSGDRLLVATGRRPRVRGLGLETVGIEPDAHAVPVDAYLRAAEHLWAIGDVNGLWPLTHVGKYQGDVVAANILGEPRRANYEAVPRVVYTDPQAAAVGAAAGRFSAMVPVSEVARTATYTRAYADENGFLTLLSDGERLTGAYALGPEAGEWLQQATLAIRAHVPLDVLGDTIQPFPTFSEIYVAALKALRGEIAAAHKPTGAGPPMAS